MKRLSVVIITLALLTIFAVRTGSVSGRVVGADGAPLKGVRVSITGSDKPVTTGDNGRFAFTNLPAAHYDVSAELAGHHDFRRRYVVEAGRDTTIEIKLTPTR